MNVKIPNEVLEIVKKLQNNGYQAFLVGGCVRDLIRSEAEGLPIKPKDWDITTNAKPEEIQKLFPILEALPALTRRQARISPPPFMKIPSERSASKPNPRTRPLKLLK